MAALPVARGKCETCQRWQGRGRQESRRPACITRPRVHTTICSHPCHRVGGTPRGSSSNCQQMDNITGIILPGKISGGGAEFLHTWDTWESPSSNTCTTLPTPLTPLSQDFATFLKDEIFPRNYPVTKFSPSPLPPLSVDKQCEGFPPENPNQRNWKYQPPHILSLEGTLPPPLAQAGPCLTSGSSDHWFCDHDCCGREGRPAASQGQGVRDHQALHISGAPRLQAFCHSRKSRGGLAVRSVGRAAQSLWGGGGQNPSNLLGPRGGGQVHGLGHDHAHRHGPSTCARHDLGIDTWKLNRRIPSCPHTSSSVGVITTK